MDRFSWIATALLLSGCTSTTSAVRTRFAAEQGCPEDRVTVDEEGGALYRARGCDKEATYACSGVGGFKGGVQCAQEGLANPPGYREPDRPTLPPPDPKLAAPQ
jgi:hypothetical protein